MGLRKIWPNLEIVIGISVVVSPSLDISVDWSRESWICRFFFLFGLHDSNFSEFMGTGYRTDVVD